VHVFRVHVAVPRLQADFQAPLSTVEWTITGQVRAPAPTVFAYTNRVLAEHAEAVSLRNELGHDGV
jgi:hypothetical protein